MNKLKLNESKTKLLQINMNDVKLNEHIEYICKKIGFLKRIKNKISTMTAINIYNTMIKPHFELGSTILYTYIK